MARIPEENIVPCGEVIYGLPVGQWALVHRDSKDMPHLAKEKGVELGIGAVEQLASSPCLNSIESTRALLQMSITEREPRTLVAVQTAVKGSWDSLDPAFTVHCCQGMSRLLAAVRAARAGAIAE